MMYGNNGYNGYNQVKVPKATKRNVEQFIAEAVNLPVYGVIFERITEEPREWKHACRLVGVGVTTRPNTLVFYDGTHIKYIICYGCNKVTYYINEY